MFGVGTNLPIAIAAVVFGLFTLFMPFFVYKIRNQVIKMNKKMDRIVEALERAYPAPEGTKIKKVKDTNFIIEPTGKASDMRIKICKECGHKNYVKDFFCERCHVEFV